MLSKHTYRFFAKLFKKNMFLQKKSTAKDEDKLTKKYFFRFDFAISQ